VIFLALFTDYVRRYVLIHIAGEPTMPELTEIVLCEACAQLGALAQSTCPHSALVEQTTKRVLSNNVIERRFRCTDCGTIWLRQTDKWGTHGSFRLAPNTQAKK